MKITILGWYGTETLGDRAILAGIFKLIYESLGSSEIYLGSLYPFFSQRTLDEDVNFWREIINVNFKVKLFDSKLPSEIDKYIEISDLIIIGGGPLMHITPMYMLRYAFKKTRKLGKPTAVFGCGIGPLFTNNFQECLLDILKFSNLIILRDKKSLKTLDQITKSRQEKIEKEIITSIDPSVLACTLFKSMSKRKVDEYVAVNLRSYPIIYSDKKESVRINNNIANFIEYITETKKNRQIKLIPMHYFHLGGDDRDFYRVLLNEIKKPNIVMQETPLTLFETMNIFQNANECYGMRLHSVILQTILNGNNFILDYTEPEVGKISGFLDQIDKKGFYNNRYVNLLRENNYAKIISTKKDTFIYNKNIIEKELGKYKIGINKLF